MDFATRSFAARARWVPYLALGLLGFFGCTPPRERPKVQPPSAWYWHSPVERQLGKSRFDELYVLAGTVGFGEEGLRWTVKQQWVSQPAKRVWLVFNADSGMLRHFGDVRMRELADFVTTEYKRQRSVVAKQGGMVAGVQLDFDVPTRRLSRYRELLRRIGEQVEESRSITLLQSWVFDPQFAALVKEVDEVVPQFYEGYLVTRPFPESRLVDFEEMERVLGRLEHLQVPFRVGVARHRQAMQVDPTGRIVSSHRGVTLAEIYRDPRFEFESVRRVGYERQVVFRAIEPGRDGNGRDYRIVYYFPDPDLEERTETWISQQNYSYFGGLVSFRLASPMERDVMVSRVTDGVPKIQVDKPQKDGSGLVDGGPLLLDSSVNISLPDGFVGLEPDSLNVSLWISHGEILIWGAGLPQMPMESSTLLPGHFGATTVRVPLRIGVRPQDAGRPITAIFRLGWGSETRQSVTKRVIWTP